MANGFSRKAMTTVLVSSLLLSAGGAVVSAAPKADPQPTGRTELNVQTGVISYNDVSVERSAKEVRLSGKVVIDGPQLVVTILGSDDTKVTKIGDKLWTFEKVVDVSSFKGDTPIEISAKTIYANGKNAGAVHTSAPTVTQEIHVPYVKYIFAKNADWAEYDHLSNRFTLKYDVFEKWSVGDPAFREARLLSVNGLENEVTILRKTLEVPTANQYITFPDVAQWDFDPDTNKFSGTAVASVINSKGHVVKEVSITRTGLQPEGVYEFSYSEEDKYGTVKGTASYTAPEAPVVDVVVDKLEDLVLTLIDHNDNQYKISASYKVVYNNKTTAEKTSELNGNIKKPNKGSETKDFKIEGLDYIVTVKYNPVTGKDEASAVLKK